VTGAPRSEDPEPFFQVVADLYGHATSTLQTDRKTDNQLVVAN